MTSYSIELRRAKRDYPASNGLETTTRRVKSQVNGSPLHRKLRRLNSLLTDHLFFVQQKLSMILHAITPGHNVKAMKQNM